MVKIVRKAKLPSSNISKGERTALTKLKKDDTIIILPADKGRATVIMDTEDYNKKIEEQLGDTNTYTPLAKDPSNKYKNKLINILRDWKRNEAILQELYWELYPDTNESPKVYRTPKIHKKGAPPMTHCV